MDGLSRAVGSKIAFRFENRDYLVGGLTVGDFAAVETHLLSQRLSLIAEASRAVKELKLDVERDVAAAEAAGKTPAEIEKIRTDMDGIIDKMMNIAVEKSRSSNIASPVDVLNFMQTAKGVADCHWLVLERSYPGAIPLDRMFEVFAAMNEAELTEQANQLAVASGTDPLGNSTGQT